MSTITFDALSTAEVQQTSCNECKDRKLKCNRNLPCVSCDRKNLECIYSTGYKSSAKRRRLNNDVQYKRSVTNRFEFEGHPGFSARTGGIIEVFGQQEEEENSPSTWTDIEQHLNWNTDIEDVFPPFISPGSEAWSQIFNSVSRNLRRRSLLITALISQGPKAILVGWI
ncbi:hypothetical protein VTL71DRAFT_6611 [Oculimacula yallundae]|uniref:Zn(2)-C6 fungal-type domain-containing protein n=1 Tax=Oculimacula yallundae TaxID=86028 RepID=A0ABR4BXK9_9HELO